MSKFKYREKVDGIKSNVEVEVIIKRIPLLAWIFGKRIYNEDQDKYYKCETHSIIYRGIIYITNQIFTRKEPMDMVKPKPGLIEISDTEKFCDYLLVKISPGKWEIRKNQFGEDWNESEAKLEVISEFEGYSDTKAINQFMKIVNELLTLQREEK